MELLGIRVTNGQAMISGNDFRMLEETALDNSNKQKVVVISKITYKQIVNILFTHLIHSFLQFCGLEIQRLSNEKIFFVHSLFLF